MTKLPTRKQALAAGAKFYMGKPCRHGHSGERYTSTNACRACMSAWNVTRPPRRKAVEHEDMIG